VRTYRLTGVLLLCLGARAACAQSLVRALDASVELGTAILRQPDLPGSSVLTLGSQLQYAGLHGSLGASGIAARTPEDRFTAQGIATASLYAPAARRFRWELATSGTAFGVSDAPATVGWQLWAREHVSIGAGGVFAGAGITETSRDRMHWPGLVGHAGGFLRLDPLGTDQLSGAVSFTRVDADRLPDREWEDLGEPFGIVGYGDAAGYWSHDRGRLQLLVGGGVRFGVRQFSATTPWGAVSTTVWLTPRLGFTGSAGRALADVLRGVPTVRYASLSLRIGFADRGTMTPLKGTRSTIDRDVGPRVDIRRGDGDLHTVTVIASTASNVEIMADFTDWEPVTLTRAAPSRGEWILSLALVPGSHRIALRIDGGEWIVPSNLPRVADEFGGVVGLLTVP
jgi:hypothetical protein